MRGFVRAARACTAAVLSVVLLVAAATAAEVPSRGSRLPLPALHAEPDPAGGCLVDAAGREVLLRGVNVNALAEYWQYGAFPTTFGFEVCTAPFTPAFGWDGAPGWATLDGGPRAASSSRASWARR